MKSYRFPFLVLLLVHFTTLAAQPGSGIYQQAMQSGHAAVAQNEFTKASSYFQAARDNLGNSEAQRAEAQFWVDSTQRLQIKALRQLNEELVVAKEKSDDALREAEASRLAVLSAQAFRAGQYRDALALAYFAQRNVVGQRMPTVQQVFGDAAYQVYRQRVPPATAPVEWTIWQPDGQRFAGATAAGQLLFYDRKGALLKEVAAHRGPLTALEYSPDGRMLVSCSVDSTIRLWTVDGLPLATLSGHRAAVLGVAFSAEEQRLLTWGRDGQAIVWDWNGRALTTLPPQGTAVYEALFLPERRLLTRSADGTAAIWDRDGKLSRQIRLAPYVFDVDYAPHTNRIAIAGADGTCLVLDARRLDTLARLRETGPIRRAVFSADGQHLLTVGRQAARVWNSATGASVMTTTHPDHLYYAGIVSSGRALFTASANGVAALWTGEGKEAARFEQSAPVHYADFAPDGQSIVTRNATGDVYLWNLHGEKLMTLDRSSAHAPPPTFSPDQKLILTSDSEQTLIISEVPTLLLERARVDPQINNPALYQKYLLVPGQK
jgi:WD40 repeat protein